MTIAALYVASPHVFVAEDQRFSGRIYHDGEWLEARGEEDSAGRRVKVQVHPGLPYIWATSGPKTVPYHGGRAAVSDLIAGALWRSTRPVEERLEDLRFLQPLVRAEIKSEPEFWCDHPKPGLVLLMGLAFAGVAGGALLFFGRNRAEMTPIGNYGFFVASSRHTTPYVDALSDVDRTPPRNANPTKIARFLRQLMTGAIDYAQEQHGELADVGGKVDVAVIGPRGAGYL